MKVAIVGGTGYVGSYVCDELIKKYHRSSKFIFSSTKLSNTSL